MDLISDKGQREHVIKVFEETPEKEIIFNRFRNGKRALLIKEKHYCISMIPRFHLADCPVDRYVFYGREGVLMHEEIAGEDMDLWFDRQLERGIKPSARSV